MKETEYTIKKSEFGVHEKEPNKTGSHRGQYRREIEKGPEKSAGLHGAV
jgi:hypothetical protein